MTVVLANAPCVFYRPLARLFQRGFDSLTPPSWTEKQSFINPAEDLGECCKLTLGFRAKPSRKRFFKYFEFEHHI